MAPVAYRTVEFHRFGESNGFLSRDSRYLRTTGWDEVAGQLSPRLDHEEFQRSLNALRYLAKATDSDVTAALARLAKVAARFLSKIEPADGGLLQLDIVTNAAELWAFPFEACFARHPHWLEQLNSGVVITRRIRGDFSATATVWPVVPRVLFLHAPVAPDLSAELIATHRAALTDALMPWSGKRGVIDDGLLRVEEITSADDIARYRQEFKPTHVHVLAHGTPTLEDPLVADNVLWGLRLGGPKARGAPPRDVSEALRPVDGLPILVTLAVCDSGNQDKPVYAKKSMVQELHKCGVPIVIGSQLPLTQPGASRLTRAFYKRLFQGEDVRVALHAARVDLKTAKDTGHDWLSVVSYVRLPPEGYAEYLENVALKVELQLLDAAQVRADALLANGGPPAAFDKIEQELCERLESLASRARPIKRTDFFEESRGLHASAFKRYAELLFLRGLHHEASRDADWPASREQLARALEIYRAGFDEAPRSHWMGGQQLVLEAVITGKVTRPEDWLAVVRSAEITRDRPSNGDEAADYWSCGTLLELHLIAPVAGQPRDLAKAHAAARLFVERARKVDRRAIETTRRQIERYTRWWTTDRGFFPGVTDLAADAGELLESLK